MREWKSRIEIARDLEAKLVAGVDNRHGLRKLIGDNGGGALRALKQCLCRSDALVAGLVVPELGQGMELGRSPSSYHRLLVAPLAVVLAVVGVEGLIGVHVGDFLMPQCE